MSILHVFCYVIVRSSVPIVLGILRAHLISAKHFSDTSPVWGLLSLMIIDCQQLLSSILNLRLTPYFSLYEARRYGISIFPKTFV